MKVRVNKLDKVFSQLIRTRDNWTCQFCGRYFPEGERRSLHCSHFHGRRKQSVRYDPLNAAAHCFSCHKYLSENPIEFARWIEGFLGAENVALLMTKANRPLKRTAGEKEELYQDLKAELARLEAA